jgi:ribonuclease P protein component
LIDHNEKNLPAKQSPPKTDPRISGSDGITRGTQRSQKTADQRPQTANGFNSGQAARLRNSASTSFKRADRLHHRREFLQIQSQGVRYQTIHFVIYLGELKERREPCLGITVSRRVGNAVKRNRIKRMVRECFRLSLKTVMEPTSALVVIARATPEGINSRVVNEELGKAVAALSSLRSKRRTSV